MRNDAHDEFDDVPSLTPDRRDDDDFEPEPQPYARAGAAPRAAKVPVSYTHLTLPTILLV